MKEKTPLQITLQELKPYLPSGLAITLSRHFEVTPQYVRAVWGNQRQNPSIIEATLLAIDSAKEKKAELNKKLSAAIS
jgi:hypothetical protein